MQASANFFLQLDKTELVRRQRYCESKATKPALDTNLVGMAALLPHSDYDYFVLSSSWSGRQLIFLHARCSGGSGDKIILDELSTLHCRARTGTGTSIGHPAKSTIVLERMEIPQRSNAKLALALIYGLSIGLRYAKMKQVGRYASVLLRRMSFPSSSEKTRISSALSLNRSLTSLGTVIWNLLLILLVPRISLTKGFPTTKGSKGFLSRAKGFFTYQEYKAKYPDIGDERP